MKRKCTSLTQQTKNKNQRGALLVIKSYLTLYSLYKRFLLSPPRGYGPQNSRRRFTPVIFKNANKNCWPVINFVEYIFSIRLLVLFTDYIYIAIVTFSCLPTTFMVHISLALFTVRLFALQPRISRHFLFVRTIVISVDPTNSGGGLSMLW